MSDQVVMTFGKYQGKSLDVVPTEYLYWLLESTDIERTDAILADGVEQELIRREDQEA